MLGCSCSGGGGAGVGACMYMAPAAQEGVGLEWVSAFLFSYSIYLCPFFLLLEGILICLLNYTIISSLCDALHAVTGTCTCIDPSSSICKKCVYSCTCT